jgi:exopolysaccharide biosynthesis protein
VLAGNKAGLTSELSEMSEEHQAVAAINGTFFNAYDERSAAYGRRDD